MFRLKSLREISGYSVKDVCEFLSCCRAQLYNLEHGKYNPDNVSYWFVKSLSDLYGVKKEYIYETLCADFSDVTYNDPVIKVHMDQYTLYE